MQWDHAIQFTYRNLLPLKCVVYLHYDVFVLASLQMQFQLVLLNHIAIERVPFIANCNETKNGEKKKKNNILDVNE